MKIKITKAELSQLIMEEVTRYNTIQELSSRKSMLEEAIKKMEEGEELDETWWDNVKAGFAGAKNVGRVGANNVGQAAKSTIQGMGQDLKAAGQDIANVGKAGYNAVAGAAKSVGNGISNAAGQVKQAGKDAAGAVSNAAGQVKNVYQQGANAQMIKDIPNEILKLRAKQKELQAKYLNLTGSYYNPKTAGAAE